MLLHPGTVDPRAVTPDVRSIVQPIVIQARELIAARLPAAGRQYCWAELLPSVVTTLLDQAASRTELSSGNRGWLEGAARRAARDWVPLHECERACEIVLGCVCKALWDE